MLTIFTTAKKFIGKNGVNQRNAVRSWLSAPYPTEVIFLDKVEGENIEQIISHPQVKIIENIQVNENGVPFINSIFSTATEQARYPLMCYLNSDIIVPAAFFEDIRNIHQQVKGNFLVVGQRIDVDVDELLTYEGDWEQTFWETHTERTLHRPTGSDFFVFPKGQYNLKNMPDLLVGRPGWDLWMIYNARLRRMKTIDLSFSSMVIHQNHDYTHKANDKKVRKSEDFHNYKFIPDKLRYKFSLIACNYYYDGQRLRKNFSRGDVDRYFKYKVWIGHHRTIPQKVANRLEYWYAKTFKRSLATAPLLPNNIISGSR